MNRTQTTVAIVAGLVMAATLPAGAQLGGRLGQLAGDAIKTANDVVFTDAEEQQLGADVSAKIREKYGVVQDAAVHKYVTLVGSVLAEASSRPKLKWTFIVLDTDGVNAFAAPGGFVHITRGALALVRNEAELADALAHEIGHITAKHTIHAIQKAKGAEFGSKALTKNEMLQAYVEKVYQALLENKFTRSEEMDADKNGVIAANKAGYAPTGLAEFLKRLDERNKGLTERSGIFASHPETEARLAGLTKVISGQKLTSTAIVQARFAQNITYKPVPVTQIAQVAPPGAAPAKAEPARTGGSGALGMAGLNPLGKEKSSSGTIASTGSRGLNPDRDAKGGPNKALVVVSVSAADIATFKKGITG